MSCYHLFDIFWCESMFWSTLKSTLLDNEQCFLSFFIGKNSQKVLHFLHNQKMTIFDVCKSTKALPILTRLCVTNLEQPILININSLGRFCACLWTEIMKTIKQSFRSHALRPQHHNRTYWVIHALPVSARLCVLCIPSDHHNSMELKLIHILWYFSIIQPCTKFPFTFSRYVRNTLLLATDIYSRSRLSGIRLSGNSG